VTGESAWDNFDDAISAIDGPFCDCSPVTPPCRACEAERLADAHMLRARSSCRLAYGRVAARMAIPIADGHWAGYTTDALLSLIADVHAESGRTLALPSSRATEWRIVARRGPLGVPTPDGLPNPSALTLCRERLVGSILIAQSCSSAAVIGVGVGAVYGGAIAGRAPAPVRFPADLDTDRCHCRRAHGFMHRRHRDLPAAPRFHAMARRAAVRGGVHPEDAVYGAIAGAVLAGQPGQRLLGVVSVYNARTG
jgi:hypothetical protein